MSIFHSSFSSTAHSHSGSLCFLLQHFLLHLILHWSVSLALSVISCPLPISVPPTCSPSLPHTQLFFFSHAVVVSSFLISTSFGTKVSCSGCLKLKWRNLELLLLRIGRMDSLMTTLNKTQQTNKNHLSALFLQLCSTGSFPHLLCLFPTAVHSCLWYGRRAAGVCNGDTSC